MNKHPEESEKENWYPEYNQHAVICGKVRKKFPAWFVENETHASSVSWQPSWLHVYSRRTLPPLPEGQVRLGSAPASFQRVGCQPVTQHDPDSRRRFERLKLLHLVRSRSSLSPRMGEAAIPASPRSTSNAELHPSTLRDQRRHPHAWHRRSIATPESAQRPGKPRGLAEERPFPGVVNV